MTTLTPNALASRWVDNYIMQQAAQAWDRRVFEKKADQARDLFENPPNRSARQYIHDEYRRQANDALTWVESNLPRLYKEYQAKFKAYLEEYTPIREPKYHSRESGYTHHYARGATDMGMADRAHRAYANTVLKLGHKLANITLDSDYADDREAYRQSTVDHYHEKLYRKKHQIPKTPPQSPTGSDGSDGSVDSLGNKKHATEKNDSGSDFE